MQIRLQFIDWHFWVQKFFQIFWCASGPLLLSFGDQLCSYLSRYIATLKYTSIAYFSILWTWHLLSIVYPESQAAKCKFLSSFITVTNITDPEILDVTHTIPTWNQDILCSSQLQIVSEAQARIQSVSGVLTLVKKQLGHEADDTPPSSFEVMYAWSYTANPHCVIMAWC